MNPLTFTCFAAAPKTWCLRCCTPGSWEILRPLYDRHGLMKAMLTVLHTLPPKDGSMSPTALQVLVSPDTMVHICNITAPKHSPLVSAWAAAAWLACLH